ncbi:MAG: hypothetical protein JXX28_03690 [Deltaproteobacteria bacterium]|nr:hypothetical protein [Deltaproteobacteria bacterium]
MLAITGTLKLYRDALTDTWGSLQRSALALGALLVATPVLLVAGVLAAPLGMAGGFIVGMLHAALVGWYLHAVSLGVVQRRRVVLSDLTRTFGVYLWEVISVLFIFWIADLLVLRHLSFGWVIVLIAGVVFNPVPELIYLGRSRSLELLADAARFVQDNWPEWIAVHLIGAGVAGGALWLLVGPAMGAAYGVWLLQLFGPWFGFISSGTLVLGLAGQGPVGILTGVLVAVAIHAWMLFRGHLFLRLSRSSRRTRAWQARLR